MITLVGVIAIVAVIEIVLGILLISRSDKQDETIRDLRVTINELNKRLTKMEYGDKGNEHAVTHSGVAKHPGDRCFLA